MQPAKNTLPVFALDPSVYTQMTATGILAFTLTQTHPDAPSFFFLRTPAAVTAFDAGLRTATR